MSDEIVLEGKSLDMAAYFDSLPERMDAKRTKAGKTHPWRNHDGEPLSYSQKDREQQAVPAHANPIGRARSVKRGRK